MYIPGGAVELCDVGDQLAGLKYSKGIYTWKVSIRVGSIAILEKYCTSIQYLKALEE